MVIMMTGSQLKQVRKQNRWTQATTAKHLGLTQGYLSLMEKGERRLTEEITERAVRIFKLPAMTLPVKKDLAELASADNDKLAADLSAIGYPGFSHVKPSGLKNPAEVLVEILVSRNLDARIVEALPWLVLTFSDLKWTKIINAAKVNDFQNRLGFVISLAGKIAELKGAQKRAVQLKKQESALKDSRLLKEDVLGGNTIIETEKRWIRQNRSPEAEFWNVLSDLKPEHLSYVS